MTVVRVLIALPIGLVFGSFLTVAVHRLPNNESLVRPRSRCPLCGTQLRARDNIPVASWVLLRGRCRSCGARISLAYPLLELATAALFVGAALVFDRVWEAVIVAPFLGLMPAIAIIDWRHRIIPNRLIYPSLLVFPVLIGLAALTDGGVDPLRALLGLASYGGGLLIVALLSPRGMGMGDVKLAALIGLVLGSLGLSFVVVAAAAGILLGGLGAIGALARGAGRKKTIPFGPFLAAGAVAAAFLGNQISDAYLGLLG